GGTPRYLLIALAVPGRGTGSQIHQLYRGLMAACRPYGVCLIGGGAPATKRGGVFWVRVHGNCPPRTGGSPKGSESRRPSVRYRHARRLLARTQALERRSLA